MALPDFLILNSTPSIIDTTSLSNADHTEWFALQLRDQWEPIEQGAFTDILGKADLLDPAASLPLAQHCGKFGIISLLAERDRRPQPRDHLGLVVAEGTRGDSGPPRDLQVARERTGKYRVLEADPAISSRADNM